MSSTHPDAVSVVAKKTGLRPDQVEQAIALYRDAASQIEVEPDWVAVSHMSGEGFGMAQYRAEGTAIALVIENWGERGETKSGRSYQFRGKAYEHYSEARAVEMLEAARRRPHLIRNPPANGDDNA